MISILIRKTLLILIIFAFGCSEYKIPQIEKDLNSTKEELIKMKQEIDNIKKGMGNLWKKVYGLEDVSNKYKKVTLDPVTKAFQRIDTTSGFFLISLQDLKPYGNGYKLILHIGNPSTANYKGFKIKIRWAKNFDFSEMKDWSEYESWNESIKEKEVSFTDILYPACWNRVELIVSPAKSDEIGFLELSMETDLVSLIRREKSRN